MAPEPFVAPRAFDLQGGRRLDFARVRVMGVLNVTPDSFSDAGRFADADVAVARGLALVEAGADVLDVGGESTRPGSEAVPAAEQIRRVVSVIARLAATVTVPISVDTTSAEVAAAALDAGASIVNDISAFRFDEAMIPLIAARRVPCVAMHTLGRPAVMQQRPRYDEVATEVRDHLAACVERCVAAGIPRHQIAIDPGIGFGKTLAHNLTLLRSLPGLVRIGQPVLVGTSRKRFLGDLTGRDVAERLMATAGSVAVAIAYGAHLVRVHDVAELRDAIIVADAIRRAPDG